MPRSDYDFLSEREREYLKAPDEVDSQRAAEISYRIRQKAAAAREDLELLRDTAKVWDKTSEYFTTEFVCRFTHPDAGPESFDCSNTVQIDKAVFTSESLDEMLMDRPNGWVLPDDPPGTDKQYGVCPECRERAIKWLRETGRVPCGKEGHRTHKPHSEPYEECVAALPLTRKESLRPNEIAASTEGE